MKKRFLFDLDVFFFRVFLFLLSRREDLTNISFCRFFIIHFQQYIRCTNGGYVNKAVY